VLSWLLARIEIPASREIVELVRGEKLLLLRFVVSSLGRTGLAMAGILLIREFLAGVLGEGDGLAATFTRSYGAHASLWLVAALLIVSHAGSSLFNYDNQVVQQRVVRLLELGVMERLIRHLLTLSVPFLDRQSHGDLIQAVRRDVSQLRVVIISMANVCLEGTLAVGLLISAVWLSPGLAFWALLVLPAATFPVVAIARRTRARSFAVRRTGFVLFDAILQILGGIRIIKAYRGEQEEAAGAIETARLYFDELVRMVRIRSLADVMVESLGGLSIAVVIIVGGFQVMAGALSWPALLAFLMAVRALHGPINNVNSNYMEIHRNRAGVKRIGELLAERPEVADHPDAVPLTAPPEIISFDDVSFTYGDANVLEGLSFGVKAGETIGIAGPSGSGKTTLLNLVARFYDPTSGAVHFDERDLREYRLADIHRNLAIVTQAPFLFASTVRDNIRCGRPEASAEEVESAARSAGIHEDILAMPEGYETPLGIGGRGVSGGQAQRIAVARAILKNAPLLLLDEATSSLDSIAESEVQRALDRLVGGRTTFVVAHRLSTLRSADRILVLDGGRCVGLGAHEALLRDCPLYRRMWETQHLGQPRGAPAPQPKPEEGVLDDDDDPLELTHRRIPA
jgi:subfamily B ATP-binding cassette protein MsbA